MPKLDFSFMPDGGEMGKLIREKDWSETAVGKVENWPQSLRTTLSILISSKFPMFLWWGKELTCFYNDAYRPSLGNNGKHPVILGQTAEKAWTEIWPVIGPMIDEVLRSGKAVWYEDQLIPIYRNGDLEDVYWTFSYSPVTDETNKIAGILVTCMETTQKVQMLTKVEASEKRFRSVVEAATVATAVFKGDNMVLEIANDIAFQNWGKDKSIIGKPLLEFMPELTGQHYPALLEKVYRTGETHTEQEAVVQRKRGDAIEIFYVDFSYKALRNELGEIDGVLVIASDVTEKFLTRKKQQASNEQIALALENQVAERTWELNEKNLELQKMNEELQSFAFVSSHDLQEPLRKILTYTDRILENDAKNLSEEGKHYFEKISIATQRMRKLIDDLLTYSRTSMKEYSFELVNLDTLLLDVTEEMNETIIKKHATIAFNNLGKLNLVRFQFHQLFLNLISNSLKYASDTRNPKIEIKTEIINGYPSGGQMLNPKTKFCHIEFRDNGIGFEPQYKENIFKIFHRLHNRSEYSGTGIGLAIVKKIIENHSGYIYADAVPEQGAVFNIYLPVK